MSAPSRKLKLTDVAEMATSATVYHLRTGRPEVAAAVQGFAAAAWGLSDGRADRDAIVLADREARLALKKLELVCATSTVRAFLRDARRLLKHELTRLEHPSSRRKRTRP